MYEWQSARYFVTVKCYEPRALGSGELDGKQVRQLLSPPAGFFPTFQQLIPPEVKHHPAQRIGFP